MANLEYDTIRVVAIDKIEDIIKPLCAEDRIMALITSIRRTLVAMCDPPEADRIAENIGGILKGWR